MSVINGAAGLGDRRSFRAIIQAIMMVTALALAASATGSIAAAQASGSQAQAPAQTKPAQDTDIPDAPTVQPNSEPAEPPPPEVKLAAKRTSGTPSTEAT